MKAPQKEAACFPALAWWHDNSSSREPVPGPLLSLGCQDIRFTFFPHKHLSSVTQKSDQQT